MHQDLLQFSRSSLIRLTGARGVPVWNSCRRFVVSIAVLAAAIVVPLLAACTTAPPGLLSVFFEPSPAPHAVANKPRRPPYKPPDAPVLIKVTKAPPPTDWVSVLELLPKTAAGGTDWVSALNESLITPKPGLDAKDEEQPVIDMDIELIPKEAPEFRATYPHKLHTALLSCVNCHTGIFQMEKGADAITMERIFAGDYCGRCHGKVAFDPITACPRCHLAMPK